MQRILLTVIASALLAGCWGGDPAIPRGVDGHTPLFQANLPTEAVIETGYVPANYQALINTHLDRVLWHPQPRLVTFQQRPAGGLVCGNIDYVTKAGEQLTKTPFIVVFNNTGTLEAMQFYTLEDIDDIIYRHEDQVRGWWGRQFFAFQADAKIIDWHTETSYDALTKCGFIVHGSPQVPVSAQAPAGQVPAAKAPATLAPATQAPSAG